MKITSAQLRKLIKEEIFKIIEAPRDTPYVLSPLANIRRFKNNPDAWYDIRIDYRDMAAGGDGFGMRPKFPGWTNQDFIDVIEAIEGEGSYVS